MKPLQTIHFGWFLSLLVLFLAATSRAEVPGPGGDLNLAYDSWSFAYPNWLDDYGHYPVAFTNILYVTNGGSGNCLLLDTTNTIPAFLFYEIVETDGTTNLSTQNGSLSLWFNPDWSSVNQGGTGPGDWGNLISLGQAGTNESWWSWYLSADGGSIYFSSQTNGGSPTNYFVAPVSFAASNWYNLVLTYGPTNTAFYTNGALVTNGPGVAFWPGPEVTFFSIGSDSNGFYQAGGKFDQIVSYNYALDPGLVAGNYGLYAIFFNGGSSPTPAGFTNSTPNPPSPATPLWFTGPGIVQFVASLSACSYSSNVWLTNVTACYATNGTTAITFTVAGGVSGQAYDVYGTTALAGRSVTNAQWAWLGQCAPCGIYQITTTNLVTACFMLGSSQQGANGNGLTLAYQALVSKTDPNTSDTDGLPGAWIALNGLTGSTNVASLDPDLDGLNNGQEYLYGTKPLVSEGFAISVNNPSGFSGIP